MVTVHTPKFLAGRFEVHELVHARGMGDVYRGRDSVSDEGVAVKVFAPRWTRDAGAVDRCRALAATQLGHPGLPLVLGSGCLPGGRLFIAERWIGGVSLHRLVEGRWDPNRAIELVARAADAVDELHRQGIAHRTINVTKVLMTRRQVHLTGCFAAPLLEPSGTAVHGDRRMALVATPCSLDFIAPEAGTEDGFFRSADIYALGVLVFRLLAGSYPFVRRSTVARALEDRRQHSAPTLTRAGKRRFPDSLESVIARALARDPAMRPTTAAAFAAELRSLSRCSTAPRGSIRRAPSRATLGSPERSGAEGASVVTPARASKGPTSPRVDEKTRAARLPRRAARRGGSTTQDEPLVDREPGAGRSRRCARGQRPTTQDAPRVDGKTGSIRPDPRRVPSGPPPRAGESEDELAPPMRWQVGPAAATVLVLLAALVIVLLSSPAS